MAQSDFVYHVPIGNVTAWGVEPVITHRTSWLENTGKCDV